MDNKEKNAVPIDGAVKNTGLKDKKEWKKPTLEDVSGRIMAQPYIRFT